MLTTPMDVLTQFPVRKSKKQKQAFRDAVQSYARSVGYGVTVEKGSMGAQNVIIGDPNAAKYLITAHYDTPAGMFLPNLITPTNPVTYIAYQFGVILIFLVLAFAAAFAAEELTGNEALIFPVWYVVYFGLLLLMMFGPANKNNANDNTSGVVTVLETMKTMPQHLRHRVCFVLFDLEEAGLVGSSSYRKAHKGATERQLVLNLDCVGDGDELMMFPTAKLKKNIPMLRPVAEICGYWGKKSLKLHKKGFSVYPSDQKNFPYGVGIAAFRRKKGVGLYCGRIHTNRDTILEETNVNILRAALTTLVGGDAAK